MVATSDEAAPFRGFNSGSILMSLLLAMITAGALFVVGLEAARISALPRLAADLPLLAVQVSARGFTLLGAEEALGPKAYAVVPCEEGACEGPASYDYDGLTARLVRVKDYWPRQDTIFVIPASGVPFETVFRTVGATTADRRPEAIGRSPRLLFPDVRVLRLRR